MQARSEVARVAAGADLSRARAITARAASTASGSALARASSSTDGRSRSSMPGTIRPSAFVASLSVVNRAAVDPRRASSSRPRSRAGVARGSSSTATRSPASTCSGSTSAARAAARSLASSARWSAQRVTIRAGGHSYHVPAQLARRGRRAGDGHAGARRRLGGRARRRAANVDVAPVVGRASVAGNVLSEIARSGRAPVSATVRLARDARRRRRPRASGCELDRAALLRRLSPHDRRRRRAVRAPCAPRSCDPAARSAARRATLCSPQPVAIDYHGARRGALTPTQLARALSVAADARIGSRSPSTATRSHGSCARGSASGSQRAHNAQFVVAGDRVRVTPSRPGRDVDPAQLVARHDAGGGRRPRRARRARRARRPT